MKKWILKAIVQKTISYLPFSHNINYIFQKYVTKGVHLTDEYFFDRMIHAREHLDAYGTDRIPNVCLELGTGWYPVVPISFFLVGVEKIYSVDISFLTSKERLKISIEKCVLAHKAGKLAAYINVKPERFALLEALLAEIDNLELDTILQKLHLTYLIEDARNLSLPDESIDLINSNNTFEHIYPHLLIPILKDFKRVLNKKTGIMSHFIDMSDHFAHFDRSITIYNFLQFSDSQWQQIDNSIQPQSRLRIDDYRKIYADLDIPISKENCREGDIEALKTVKLAPRFAQKPFETVAISHAYFLSKWH